ncbi:hypothetical protein MMC18_005313 [Xylographa bjoerkii]|nr:hypothetical protein [Xylographa bjoerkii]
MKPPKRQKMNNVAKLRPAGEGVSGNSRQLADEEPNQLGLLAHAAAQVTSGMETLGKAAYDFDPDTSQEDTARSAATANALRVVLKNKVRQLTVPMIITVKPESLATTMSRTKRPRTGFDEDEDFQKRIRLMKHEAAAIEAETQKYRRKFRSLRDAQSQPKQNTLLDFLAQHEQYYPMFDRLYSYLDVSDIVALTRTCKQFSGLDKLLLNTQWNVDRRLRRFVGNPKEFRALLGRHDALVSGDFALQFFERQVRQDCDLDIFVRKGSDTLALCNYLTDTEDYTSSPIKYGESSEQDIPPTTTLTLSRLDRDQIDFRKPKITLHCSHDIPLQEILETTYTTSLMNIISWNKAYSIFPLPTHIQHKTYLLTNLDDHFGALLSEQSRRGWDVQDVLWQEEESPFHPVQFERFIGDELTWIIPFDVDDMEQSKTPDQVLEYSQFGLDKVIHLVQHQEFYNYRISTIIFEACTMRYRYTHSGFNESFWNDFVSDRMDRLTRLQLYLMEPKHRPLHAFDDPDFGVHEGSFAKPPDWKYYDDKIPEWYEVWK